MINRMIPHIYHIQTAAIPRVQIVAIPRGQMAAIPRARTVLVTLYPNPKETHVGNKQLIDLSQLSSLELYTRLSI